MPMTVPNRITWRCRRGIRELDLVFSRFLAQQFDTLNADDRASFELLIEQSDLDIYDWLLGRSEPPTPAFARLIAQLQPANA